MENALILLGVACIGAVIGAFAGLGLFSFTTLSPLIIGALVAGAFPAFIAACAIGLYYFRRNEITENFRSKKLDGKRLILAAMPLIGTIVLTDIAIGVVIAAIADAILPGIFATWWAAAAGAVIGAVVAPVMTVAVLLAFEMFKNKIADYARKPGLSLKDVYLNKEEKRGYHPV
ncbi:hypothetical protein [Wolbachia endosymbiont (group E) of Neria commutata]|uniref:hypothetical protein n=1 Tax=Wolbachia endosymbiont (group E) of Neria commutata TaxID=3066149 RepID=UPI003132A26D